jgi:hypothetical protein
MTMTRLRIGEMLPIPAYLLAAILLTMAGFVFGLFYFIGEGLFRGKEALRAPAAAPAGRAMEVVD